MGNSILWQPWLRFFRAFSSVVRQMPGLNSQVGHGPHSSKVFVIVLCYRLSVVIVLCCYLCCSVIIELFYVLIVCTVTLPPGVNQIAVDKYIYIYYIYLFIYLYEILKHPELFFSLWNFLGFFLYVGPQDMNTVCLSEHPFLCHKINNITIQYWNKTTAHITRTTV